MYYPTTRVLTVLELLQSHQQLNGPELAERLEVDIRTVRRYITMLQDLGIPVVSERGRYGAYRLRPGYKLPPLMFTEDEALALVLGLLATRKLGLAFAAPAVEGALAKVERVMPAALRQRVQAVQETLILAVTPSEGPPASKIVVTFSTAAQQSQRVWMRYRSGQAEETERTIDPYGLVYRAGRWYAVGYCHLRKDMRVFRLDRVLQAEIRESVFYRPLHFDCLKQVEQAIAKVPGTWLVEIILATTIDEARKRVPATLAILEQVPEGTLMRCYIEELSWMAHFLAGLDCHFTIQRPAELREALSQLAKQIATLAREPG